MRDLPWDRVIDLEDRIRLVMACCLCNVEGFDHSNTPKSPCSVIKRSPCAGCLRLRDLDCEILEVKSHLEALLASRKALLTKVNEKHDPIVHRLPLELATYIFSLCNPFQPSMEVFSKLANPNIETRGDESVPFTLGAVCRAWRAVVFSTPHLWNTLSMTLKEGSSPNKGDLLEQWLARSGNHPLFVRVSYLPPSYFRDPPAPATVQLLTVVLATLRQVSRRFRVLELSVPAMNMSPLRDAGLTSPQGPIAATPATILDNIKVKIDARFDQPLDELVVFDLGFLPSPRNLVVSGILWRNVKVDITNITHLTVSYCGITDIIGILLEIPLLHSLNLSLLTCHDDHLLPEPANPVAHHSLQILDVDILGTDANFFDFFSFPSLQTLSCYLNQEPLDDLSSLFLRSQCRLKSLDLIDFIADEEALFGLLQLTPSLTSLRIVGTEMPDAFFTKFGSTARLDDDVAVDHLLPHLDTLVFQGVRSFEWSSIPLLFPNAELLGQGGDFRRITEVGLVMDTDDQREEDGEEDYIDKETVERILDLHETVKIFIVDMEDNNLLLSSMKHHGMVEDTEDEMGEDSTDDITNA